MTEQEREKLIELANDLFFAKRDHERDTKRTDQFPITYHAECFVSMAKMTRAAARLNKFIEEYVSS